MILHKDSPKTGGFTLVELSIVLVILGLLVGGVLTGQSLIRAAELRSVGVDWQRYRSAAYTFRDKYFALPGDMANATSFWGVLAGTGSDATCQNTAATGAATCNGNGDGIITTFVVTNDENARFWQHLANAGLVEGFYIGSSGSSNLAGVNAPRTRVATNSLWLIRNIGTSAGTTAIYAGVWDNYFLPRGVDVSGASGTFLFLPAEAWNIDAKLDDGQPGTGIILAAKGNGTTVYCTTAAGVAPPGDAGSTYRLDLSVKDCTLYFLRSI